LTVKSRLLHSGNYWGFFSQKIKKTMPEARNRANKHKEVCRISWFKFIWAGRYGILPVCPPLVTACPIHGAGGHGRLSAPAQMDSEKRNRQKSRKSTSSV